MWAVDTGVVRDVFENDPQFGKGSAALLGKLPTDGLAVSAVTMVEVSAAFEGGIAEQKRFLEGAGISHAEAWTAADIDAAHKAWNACVIARRKDKAPKRTIADILIGGFAANRQGLVTRNPLGFRRWFPKLVIRAP
jgi:predicted nucleic acid-binding protein